MKPPVQYLDTTPQRSNGCGCSLGCFGIGCLLSIVGFIGLLSLLYYATLHTSLPLKLIERAIEEDGRAEIEGLTGNIASGLHFDKFRFLTEDKHWSELNDVTVRYDGLVGINVSGDIEIHEVRIGGGTLYLDIEQPEQFALDVPALDMNEFMDEDEREALKHVGEWNLHDVQVGKVDIVNPRTGYRFSIDHMKISGMKFRRGELLDPGEWSIASDFLTVTTEASRLWPHSDAARRIVGTIHKDFFSDLKADFGFVVEIAGGESPLQYHAECADGKMVLDENGHRTMIEYNDYSVDDFFQTPRQIPLRHVTFRASRPTPPQEESTFLIESRGSFQLGETEFEIPAGAFELQDRTLLGTAERDGRSYQARIITQSAALTRPVIQLTVGDQPANVDDWAAVVFHQPADALRSREVEMLEDAMARSAEDAEDDEAIEVEVEEDAIKAEREPGDTEQ